MDDPVDEVLAVLALVYQVGAPGDEVLVVLATVYQEEDLDEEVEADFLREVLVVSEVVCQVVVQDGVGSYRVHLSRHSVAVVICQVVGSDEVGVRCRAHLNCHSVVSWLVGPLVCFLRLALPLDGRPPGYAH